MTHTNPQVDRINLMAHVLMQHGTVPGPACHCGHQYRPGDFIPEHRARVLDAALSLRDAGLEDHDVIAHAATEVERLSSTH
jgi:hypothetical protein